jgi:two-component system, chemotaxis family, protein-glutamate methylesterase/glutaminase
MSATRIGNLPWAIALGASAGGVETLTEVVASLPKDFPAAIFVVLHVPPYQESRLPQILSNCGSLPACHPEDGTKIRAGNIYIAPPDHHLLIEDKSISVKRGPKENRFRPSIDALFRSVAYTYRSQAVGVVLSGLLDDGTSGLWTIKRLGGIAIVQQPNDAKFESMPLSALEQVKVDHLAGSGQIGPLLEEIVNEKLEITSPDPVLLKRVKTELQIAAEANAFQKGIMDFGQFTAFTCPECHGVLVRLMEDKMTRYRCHTGHGYSDSALLEAVMESTGELLWQVMRAFEEAAMVVGHMAEYAASLGDNPRAKALKAKAEELEQRSKPLHDAVLRHEALSGDNAATK